MAEQNFRALDKSKRLQLEKAWDEIDPYLRCFKNLNALPKFAEKIVRKQLLSQFDEADDPDEAGGPAKNKP